MIRVGGEGIKVSELIAQLEAIRAEHGDIPVRRWDGEYMDEPVTSTEILHLAWVEHRRQSFGQTVTSQYLEESSTEADGEPFALII